MRELLREACPWRPGIMGTHKSGLFWLGCGLIRGYRHHVDPSADSIDSLESRRVKVVEKGPVMTTQGAFRSRTPHPATDDYCGCSPSSIPTPRANVSQSRLAGWLAYTTIAAVSCPTSLSLAARDRQWAGLRADSWLKLSWQPVWHLAGPERRGGGCSWAPLGLA